MKTPPRSDLHTHTPLCHHAEGTPEEYIKAAAAAGLTCYGISDHAPQSPEPFDDWRMSWSDLPAYLAWIERARSAADFTVLAGLECDWLPNESQSLQHLEKIRNAHSWDYLIGSVHYLELANHELWDFDNPAHLSRWKSFSDRDLHELWENYWANYLTMVRSQSFEIYAHPDLIKKFSFVPSGDLRPYYEPIISALADSGQATELNTAGWHKPCSAPYPGEEFLSLLGQAQVPVYLNSDAHHPNEVARDFERAYELALTHNLLLGSSLPK